MVKKSEYWEQEAQRLTLVLANIFENLPKSGEERDATWEKIGSIRAYVWSGLLGKAWLEMSNAECEDAVRSVLPAIREACACWLVTKPEGGAS